MVRVCRPQVSQAAGWTAGQEPAPVDRSRRVVGSPSSTGHSGSEGLGVHVHREFEVTRAAFSSRVDPWILQILQ